MTALTPPLELTSPPPFRRDRMVHAWIGVKALSDAGDAVWTIALAWTAVQIASPPSPDSSSPPARFRARWCCSSAGSSRIAPTPAG